jgi:hypothetical protein
VSKIADGYRRFAEVDCVDRSPLYGELTAGVAEDTELLAWLERLPTGKRQPARSRTSSASRSSGRA